MKKFEKKDYILIGILVLLLIILGMVLKNNNESNNLTSNNLNSNYTVENDKSLFFTIEECVNRYINAVSQENTSDLIKLLDKKYISDNLITKENILNKIGSLNNNNSFKALKMYKTTSSNSIKYYVYGLIQKETIDGYDKGTDYYVIITTDKEIKLFSVTPYDGEIFKEI